MMDVNRSDVSVVQVKQFKNIIVINAFHSERPPYDSRIEDKGGVINKCHVVMKDKKRFLELNKQI